MNSPPPPAPPPVEAAAEPPPVTLRARIERPENVPLVDTAGEFFSFIAQGFAGFRFLPKFTAEVMRQVGILASGSVLVVVFMAAVAGAATGLAAEAAGQAIGVGIAGPMLSSYIAIREVVPFIFGFIVAAKIGGGIVAQLGAMRVNEEVDAMEIMGIPSISFLVSTRMLAAMIVLPIAYLLSVAAGIGFAWLTSYVRTGAVSQGTWELVFFIVTTPTTLIYSLIKGMVLSGATVMTALYFGHRVRGGPVEVGTATAQSMAVNLILVTLLNLVMTFVFWGFDPGLPIA